jgi:hypothetical protein
VRCSATPPHPCASRKAAPSPDCWAPSHARASKSWTARPHSLSLAGRHGFARYMLTFELTDAAQAATHLRAWTCALFPGARGQAYRALVIGTRAHTAAATHILRSVRRPSLAPA